MNRKVNNKSPSLKNKTKKKNLIAELRRIGVARCASSATKGHQEVLRAPISQDAVVL
jgi:hypothetical protein